MRKLLLLLLLSGCFSSLRLQEPALAQSLSPRKQRQKIASLEKKLEAAEKEQRKAQNSVEQLASEIEEAKIALIRKQVDDYERKNERSSALFLEEREALYRMIQTGPSSTAFQAQTELDRILRIITERSDEGKPSS